MVKQTNKNKKARKTKCKVILLNSYPLTVVKILTVRECSYGAITQTAHELYSFSLPIVLNHNVRYSFCKVIRLIPC